MSGEMMRMARLRSLWRCLLCAAMALPFAGAAAGAADFYAGKTIIVLIGYSPGGLYDINARLIARYLGSHIPGKPTVQPENMPGAGSRNLANHLYTNAAQDGTVIGMVGRTIALEALLQYPGTRFDPLKMHWIGSPTREVSTCVVWHTSPVMTLDDVMKRPTPVGAAGSGSEDDVFPRIMNEMIGTQFKVINGYPGGNNITQAMEGGELDGRCGWSWGSIKSRAADWLHDKKIRVILQMGLDKAPDLPGVPSALELVKKADDKQVLELLFAPQRMAWPLVAPPGVPADRVVMLRRAFDETMKDAGYLAEAKKLSIDVDPLDGAGTDALIAGLYKAPPAVVQRARKLEFPNL